MPTSDYFAAANVLKGKQSKRKIVAYVESYDDVLFWRMALSELEDDTRCFEVMLPSRDSLCKGKKQALVSLMKHGAGENMIACVDADYDYLLQGKTPLSAFLLNNPFVCHTYVYAIENYQCYAPTLHNVCVMATLNDHQIFDFEGFLTSYSKILFPLFVWNIMLYRGKEYGKFTITDFNAVASIKHGRLQNVQQSLDKLRQKVNVKIRELQRRFPGRKELYLQTKTDLLSLGVTPETTYLYIQGHHLFDSVVVPMMQTVCDELRREQEREIRAKAKHVTQMHNELSSYQHSQSDVATMLKRNQMYQRSPIYKRMIHDLEQVVNSTTKP
ncbi:MAG: DUF4435 domain-containing protein [Prevotella sp.]|nr:DUF4435 domain-containing protein [Candidatus Prevotella equi]